jgi:hypothetical protein
MFNKCRQIFSIFLTKLLIALATLVVVALLIVNCWNFFMINKVMAPFQILKLCNVIENRKMY